MDRVNKCYGCSHPLLHTLDDEAQVFTHLLFVQVLLFTPLPDARRGGKERETVLNLIRHKFNILRHNLNMQRHKLDSRSEATND